MRALDKVKVGGRTDLRVRWEPTMRPSGAADVEGTVFISKGRTTSVRWDGGGMQFVATKALVVVD